MFIYWIFSLTALLGSTFHHQALLQLPFTNNNVSVPLLLHAGLFAANGEENALGLTELGANAIVDNGRSILDGDIRSTNPTATNL